MACACVNACAGMEPGAVAALVAAAERLLAAESEQEPFNGLDMSELREALAALKGGAK